MGWRRGQRGMGRRGPGRGTVRHPGRASAALARRVGALACLARCADMVGCARSLPRPSPLPFSSPGPTTPAHTPSARPPSARWMHHIPHPHAPPAGSARPPDRLTARPPARPPATEAPRSADTPAHPPARPVHTAPSRREPACAPALNKTPTRPPRKLRALRPLPPARPPRPHSSLPPRARLRARPQQHSRPPARPHLLARAQQEGAHGGGQPKAVGLHVGAAHHHGVVDAHPRRHAAARRVDEELDVLRRDRGGSTSVM